MCQIRQGFLAGDDNVFFEVPLSDFDGERVLWPSQLTACVSIKIMTPKGQIVGKVYIIETITADKGCKVLRCTVYTN